MKYFFNNIYIYIYTRLKTKIVPVHDILVLIAYNTQNHPLKINCVASADSLHINPYSEYASSGGSVHLLRCCLKCSPDLLNVKIGQRKLWLTMLTLFVLPCMGMTA